MANTHKQFVQQLHSEANKWEERIQAYQEYKKQRIKNKYANWLIKRKKEQKDYSLELFERLQAYFKREQQKFDEISKKRTEISLQRYNSGYADIADDELMYQIKHDLYKWRDQDDEYQKMKEEIEEFRMISDKPVQSIDGR